MTNASTPAVIADLFIDMVCSVLREMDVAPCKLELENKIRVSLLSGIAFGSPEEVC